MSSYSFITLEIDARGVAFVTLNRPEVHNAFDSKTIEEIHNVFEQLNADKNVRLAVLSGNGKSFCAGGDLNWMKAMKGFTQEKNIADSMHLARMFGSIRHFAAPVIGVIQGFALGGGSGLASVCDYVVASEDATFGFTEARLGLVPATIAPFVIEKIGAANARAYFLSGATFPASTARDIGLVQKIVPYAELEKARDETITTFLKAGPNASRKAKELINEVMRLKAEGNALKLTEYTVHAIAQARVSDEGQEGMAALLEGRKPAWVQNEK
jgi:methylglutaconyl-CoA hydratase